MMSIWRLCKHCVGWIGRMLRKVTDAPGDIYVFIRSWSHHFMNTQSKMLEVLEWSELFFGIRLTVENILFAWRHALIGLGDRQRIRYEYRMEVAYYGGGKWIDRAMFA